MTVSDLPELGLMAVGAGGSFAGAFTAIKVHIGYLIKHNDAQDERLKSLEARVELTDRKADRAHQRLDYLTEGNSA